MGFLTEIHDNAILTKHGKIIINPAFDIVLEIQRLLKDTDLKEVDKINTTLDMLVKNNWVLRQYNIQEKAGLVNTIYNQFITVKQRNVVKKNKVPVLDFEEDGEYIYASFLKDYGIDLLMQQGRLSWKRFIALFGGLSDDTKIKQVMRIRSMEIPEYTGKNQKQIQNIMELKSYYALPIQGGGGQKGLDALFSSLEGMANQ